MLFNVALAGIAAVGFVVLNARFVGRGGRHSFLVDRMGRQSAIMLLNVVPLAYGIFQISYYTGILPVWADIVAKLALGLQVR